MGPAAVPSAVRRPEALRTSLLAGVPMTRLTVSTPGSPVSVAAIRMRATESAYRSLRTALISTMAATLGRAGRAGDGVR
ncbi:hypothetical protein GA0115251_12934 [Streptomyces sp. TverLS-915]|nr:hypothetical protein GA0115251_12934 [Streptomyces sp. TverLS-915]